MRHACLAVVGIAWVLTTALRAPIWTDERALWADAVAKAPQKPRPYVNLGKQYHLRGAGWLAEGAYREAIRISQAPTRSQDERVIGRALAEANLALVRLADGDLTGARSLIAVAHDRVPWLDEVADLNTWIRAFPVR